MGRLVRDSRLESREARSRLKARKEPYWRLISENIHLGYYRGERGGVWHARIRTLDGKRYVKTAIGKADDYAHADGKDNFSFSQAQEKARQFAIKISRGIDPADNKPYTVQHAVDDYLHDFKANGKKSFEATQAQINAHILPAFSDYLVSDITFKQLNTWKNKLATTPKRTRTSVGEEQQFKMNETNDPEYQRKRRATANRIISIFKAILNHAFYTNRIPSNEAWQKLKPFKNVTEPKVRFLSEPETIRLINTAEPHFRLLIRGALLTGARYGELTALRISDYNHENNSIFIQQSKSGKPRYIPLNQEGVKFFKQLIVGKSSIEFIFTRANGSQWKKNFQSRPLQTACKAASIIPAITFHDLRHTYASILAMKGVPLQVISAVLGHSDTRITHKHYAHLMPSYIADVIREHLPDFGETEESNVSSIILKKVSSTT